jgi:nitrogenase-associated protein
MTHLVFFEKPGCGGNARQRALLLAAGHTLERRNLLSTPWTRESLLAFLAPLPVAEWFNRAAPRVKNGEVLPHAQTVESAINLLLAEPLLIRRPLMQRIDNQSRHVGFDTAAVDAWIGLGTEHASPSMEGCPSPTERCATPPTGEHHAPV